MTEEEKKNINGKKMELELHLAGIMEEEKKQHNKQGSKLGR